MAYLSKPLEAALNADTKRRYKAALRRIPRDYQERDEADREAYDHIILLMNKLRDLAKRLAPPGSAAPRLW